MRKWWNTYIKSLRKDIVILLIIDSLILLLMELVLKKIPAPFPVFVTLGNFTITLGVSFIASFIFYFVQVHLPETKQKTNLYPGIATLYSRMLSTEKMFLTNYVGVKSYSALTEENILNGAKSREVSIENAPLVLAGLNRSANWMEYGFNEVSEIDQTWEMIMKYSSYLDSECLSILAKIQSNSVLTFFRRMRGIYYAFPNGVNIHGFEQSYVELWRFIQVQEEYYNMVFAEYCFTGDKNR